MPSEKQILANRRNAKKSTGPKSVEGKTASRINAFKHGLLSTEITVPGEDPDKFAYLRSELEAELDPIGFQESEIVERMAVLMWRLRRLYRVEAGIFTYGQALAERNRAQEERLHYENTRLLYDMTNLSTTQLTDKDKHAEASEIEGRAEKRLAEVSTSIGIAFMRDAERANALTKLSRYETTMERSLSRLRTELERLQRKREEKSGEIPVTIDHLN